MSQNSRREIVPHQDDAVQEVYSGSLSGLPELPCGWAVREYRFSSRTLKLIVPDRPELLLDDPKVRNASRADDYMPYWAFLWPASLAMSEAVLESGWSPGTQVLELGCGLGLVGLSALSIGCHVVTSDYEPQALAVAQKNALINGFQACETLLLDWRQPLPRQFQIILGCDLLYEERNLIPILDLLDVMLMPRGECWLADGGRQHAVPFVDLARERGYVVRLQDANGHEIPVAHSDTQLFRLHRPEK